jgi:hypothetical protein
MKTNDLLLIAVVGFLGYILILKMQPTATPLTPTSNPAGGTSPAGTPDIIVAVSGAIQSIFNSIGSIGQTTPKTT